MKKSTMRLSSAAMVAMLSLSGLAPSAMQVVAAGEDQKAAGEESTGNAAEAVTQTRTITGDDLQFTHRWNPADTCGSTITFAKGWEEYRVSLGEAIPGDAIESVKFNFKEATPNICFKTYSGDNEFSPAYGQSGKTSYTYFPSTSEDVTSLAIMAMEDGNNFDDPDHPVQVVVDSIEITYDMSKAGPVDDNPEMDIVNLRDQITKEMGDDFIVGTAISYMEFADQNEMSLVTKHFNGVTLGNELKPDSMIKKGANIKEYDLNGQTVAFPELDYSTPDTYLDYFVKWNEEHPDQKIRIRGHVLVWHSQTPEFIFHENFDENAPYVSPEVMNQRLEVYIREVANHYTQGDSKYKSLFYGWDVVNEAVSDSTGTYRNGEERSSWWKVYNSPEFIRNAFVYANKYMPENIALFYNDYNEYVPSKVKGISNLLDTVKNTPGARINGMGMQAHYQVDNNAPTMDQIKKAAKEYSKYVDQIQFTELDFKGSANSHDERLANRYKAVYDTIRRLKNEGVNVTGMTIWGIVDKHSWLQTANDVGGSSDGSVKQYPLLFDDHYKAKNAFYALANAGELEPEIHTLVLNQLMEGKDVTGESYELDGKNATASFIPVWDENGITVAVDVKDATIDDSDKVVLYIDDGNGIQSVSANRTANTAARARKAKSTMDSADGYKTTLTIPVDQKALMANTVKLDLAVTDGDDTFAYNDTTLQQASTSKYYAETSVKPMKSVNKGTVTIDGDGSDDAWKNAESFELPIVNGAKATGSVKVLWDDDNLYLLMDVKDPVLNKDNSEAHQQDSVEVFIDEDNAKSAGYEADDKQYRINFENTPSFNGTKCSADNLNSKTVLTEDGYRIEAAFKWTDIKPEAGSKIGFDVQINDADESGVRIGTANWADKSGTGWSSPAVFGTLFLDEVKADEPKADTPKADDPKSDTPKTDDPKSETPKNDKPADQPTANVPADKPAAQTPAAGNTGKNTQTTTLPVTNAASNNTQTASQAATAGKSAKNGQTTTLPRTNDKVKAPKTGDENNAIKYIVTIMAALAAAAAFLIAKKSRR